MHAARAFGGAKKTCKLFGLSPRIVVNWGKRFAEALLELECQCQMLARRRTSSGGSDVGSASHRIRELSDMMSALWGEGVMEKRT